MLTSGAIREAILNGQVSVTYSCLPKKGGGFRFLDSEASLDNAEAQKFFEKCIGENRIKLTVGPLVKSIYKKNVDDTSKYYNFEVHDLRKTSYTMDPLETIIVYTNEWIHLKEKHAGIIIQRVAHYFKGLNIAPSYIASGWQGILLAQITNNSIFPLKISMGDDIARLFIFETTGTSEEIPNSSIHFGNKWHDYIDHGRNPFEEFAVEQNCDSSDDMMSSLISMSVGSSVELQKKLAALIVSHQMQPILDLLKESSELKMMMIEIFNEDKKGIIARLISYLPEKKVYKIPLSIVILLSGVYLLASGVSFYMSIFSTDPSSSIKNLLDAPSWAGRLKEAEKQVSDLQSATPIYGTSSITIDKKESSAGKEQESNFELGKRSKFIVLNKSASCGEIESRPEPKEKKTVLKFTAKNNPVEKGECKFDWVLTEGKN
jgi:deoxycytidine triphosphate deaminase